MICCPDGRVVLLLNLGNMPCTDPSRFALS